MTHPCSGLNELFVECDKKVAEEGREGAFTATAIAANAYCGHVAGRLKVLADYLENVCYESCAEFDDPARTFEQLANLDRALREFETAVWKVGGTVV